MYFSAPPSSLKLYFINGTTTHEIKEGDEFTFADGETAHVKCVVNGSNPEPMARMVIGTHHLDEQSGLTIHEPKKYESASEHDRRIARINVSALYIIALLYLVLLA